MVPEVRFELTRCRQRRILSPLRLPFRHSGAVNLIIVSQARPLCLDHLNKFYFTKHLHFIASPAIDRRLPPSGYQTDPSERRRTVARTRLGTQSLKPFSTDRDCQSGAAAFFRPQTVEKTTQTKHPPTTNRTLPCKTSPNHAGLYNHRRRTTRSATVREYPAIRHMAIKVSAITPQSPRNDLAQLSAMASS